MGTGQELARAELQATEDMFERRKVLRTLAVPTDDNKVRERLRAFGLPMTLFGERVCYPYQNVFTYSHVTARR